MPPCMAGGPCDSDVVWHGALPGTAQQSHNGVALDFTRIAVGLRHRYVAHTSNVFLLHADVSQAGGQAQLGNKLVQPRGCVPCAHRCFDALHCLWGRSIVVGQRVRQQDGVCFSMREV